MIAKEIHFITLILLKKQVRNFTSIVSPSNEILKHLGITCKYSIWPCLVIL